MPVGNPTPPLVGGTSVRNPILQGYVYQSGIHKPEHSGILTYKFPQYYMTSLLDRLGAFEPVSQDRWSWSILDRTRFGGTVSSVSGVGTATATFEVTEFDYDESAGNLGYLIPGDIIRTESGALLRVTAVDVSSTLTDKQEVTVVRHNGGTISATDLANSMKFGHAFTAFGEGSEAPIGRVYLPTEDDNVLTILRKSFSITGSEFTNKTYLNGGEAWYWTVEDIHQKEFARDREVLILAGQKNASGVKISRGILDWVLTEGVISTYATASTLAEADIMEHIRKLRVQGGSSEYLVLCGSSIYVRYQKALQQYTLNGGISFGSFGSNDVGLDVDSYRFFGTKIHFVHYELFNDTAVFPYTATASSGKINFDEFALWLDLGKDSSGRRLITLKYKELAGKSRKFIYRYELGMMSPEEEEGNVASGFDGFKVHMLSEIGVEVRCANRMGIHRANS